MLKHGFGPFGPMINGEYLYTKCERCNDRDRDVRDCPVCSVCIKKEERESAKEKKRLIKNGNLFFDDLVYLLEAGRLDLARSTYIDAVRNDYFEPDLIESIRKTAKGLRK